MQLVVETAGIADDIAGNVSAPFARLVHATVCAADITSFHLLNWVSIAGQRGEKMRRENKKKMSSIEN